MTRVLKTSGFVALALQMLWGIYNVTVVSAPGGPSVTGDALQLLVSGHAHFGVLAILAVVLGLAVDHYDVRGTRRAVVQWPYVVGQWLLPATFLAIMGGYEMVGITSYLWGLLLFVPMAVMAWIAFSGEPSAAGSTA